MTTSTSIDPIALEVLWSRLLSVTNEQQAALMRTAFSTVVRESQDLACGVFDTAGNMVAQSETGTPGHINAMATCMRHFMAAYPEGTLEAGDVLITNDPWMTAGQINDVTLVTPIFRDGRVVAYFANTCHMLDIGGRILSAEAREVYEEGLYIPITRLFARGDRNEELFKIIRGNVRTPREVEGDLYAMASCNDVGGTQLLEFMREFSLDSIDPLSQAIVDRSERATRAAIERLPDGVYENEVFSDGFPDPVLLKARVTVAGSELTVDHTGSSPQSRYGINVVMNYTHAYTSFAVKCAISPEVPHNEGSFRPVHVTAPPGCILNALHPAPVAARHLIGHFLPGLIFGALAGAMPDRLMADGAASIWITMFRGTKPRPTGLTPMALSSEGQASRMTLSPLSLGGQASRMPLSPLPLGGEASRMTLSPLSSGGEGGRGGEVRGEPQANREVEARSGPQASEGAEVRAPFRGTEPVRFGETTSPLSSGGEGGRGGEVRSEPQATRGAEVRTPDRDPYTFMLFQCGGTGARPTKDGLNNVGFPSGVAGVPAEVMESLTGLVVERKEVRTDSGGPGKFRGGCGQFTTFADRSGESWSMSGMYDRLKFAAQGLLGGQPGMSGEFHLSDGRQANPKELLFHEPYARVRTALPGGGGYGNPFERDPSAVLSDVVNDYVSLAAAEREYGVVIRSTKRPDEQISLPEHFSVDEAATEALRARGSSSSSSSSSSS